MYISVSSVTAAYGFIPPVGASLLAMDVNANAPCLDDRVGWATIASRLAPTFDWGVAERDQSIVRSSSPAGWLPQLIGV
ncbi:hypothetical protein EJA72_15715 [Pseudomonas sp. PB120]|nr:hypothetical protein [Pseudomonas sp. PB120]